MLAHLGQVLEGGAHDERLPVVAVAAHLEVRAGEAGGDRLFDGTLLVAAMGSLGAMKEWATLLQARSFQPRCSNTSVSADSAAQHPATMPSESHGETSDSPKKPKRKPSII